jgi:aldose sugar dehydrogenase
MNHSRGEFLGLAGALLVALAACGGGGGGGGTPPPAPPTAVTYAQDPLVLRMGVPATPDAATVTGGTTDLVFTVSPSLPAGLTLDASTGLVSGTPGAPVPTSDFVVTASNDGGEASTALTIQVTPPLPPTMTALEPGFEATVLQPGLTVPVRMAFAPDGRLFFNELTTGNVRVIDPAGNLLPAPVATFAVLAGAHQGLLGLAAAPDFATSSQLFVYASVPAAAGHPDRNQVLRLTLTGNAATAVDVIVDDLPIGNINNGGHLAFGPVDGRLYVTIGDTDVPALAQTPGVRPGRVLRYGADGSVPADNPIALDPEWCRGLRNTFALTFHVGTGGLFGGDNGPAANDELNFIQAGKDFGWPTPVAGGGAGIRLVLWPEVIAPTALAFYEGTAFGPDYEDDLFLAGYVNEELRRLELSGPALTDLDSDTLFAKWVTNGVANKPLDVKPAPDGSLYVSTFDSIYRIRRSP